MAFEERHRTASLVLKLEARLQLEMAAHDVRTDEPETLRALLYRAIVAMEKQMAKDTGTGPEDVQRRALADENLRGACGDADRMIAHDEGVRARSVQR